MKITLKTIGKIDERVVADLRQRLHAYFGCPVTVGTGMEMPGDAADHKRMQCMAPVLLDSLSKNGARKPGEKILGIADVDIYAPGSNYVFGQADPARDIALISLCRLRQELPPDYELLVKRATIEAVHEIGHTLGLGHCSNGTCVMHFSNSLHDTDLKGYVFCNTCQPRLIK